MIIPNSKHYELKPGHRHYTLKPSSVPMYRLSTKTQLEAWVRGHSEHNKEFDECVPDFSCCSPHSAWSDERRQAFYIGDQERRAEMLYEALQSQIKTLTNYEPPRPSK